jgi:TetR/AcrR family transcriptional repressor of nem operon
VNSATEQRARGRPRAFDEEAFLDEVIRLFSADGFAGVSMSEITAASGLTTGSIYKAYGDKEGVFDAALRRYIALRETGNRAILADCPDGRSKLAKLLEIYLSLSSGKDGLLGCMVVSGLADIDMVGKAADRLRDQLRSLKSALREIIAEGQGDGSIPPSVDQESAATLMLALLQGLRVLGKAGLVSPADPQPITAAMLRIVQ